MKAFQRILAVLLCLVMSLGMISMVASAATVFTSGVETGTLTIHKYNTDSKGENGDGSQLNPAPDYPELDEVEFTVYRVMDKTAFETYLTSTTAAALDATSYYSANNAPKPKYVANSGLTEVAKGTTGVNGTVTGVTGSASEGQVSFTLSLGVYLVVETNYPDSVTAPMTPFLVSIPTTINTEDENNNVIASNWEYNVHVYPKNSTSSNTVSLKKLGNPNADGIAAGLDGVTFTLLKKNADGTWPVTGSSHTTTGGGEISFGTLTHGTYRIIETATATDYILDKRPIEFTIAATADAENGIEKGQVTITTGNNRATANKVENGYVITVTNDKPTVDKAPTDAKKPDTIGVGDEIEYSVTAYVPRNIAELGSFTITDTPTGMKVKTSVNAGVTTGVTVKCGNDILDEETNYTINYGTPANGYTITLTNNAMANYAGKYLTITYTAIITSDAAKNNHAENTARVDYNSVIDTDGTPGEPEEVTDKEDTDLYNATITKELKGATNYNEVNGTVKFKLYDGNTVVQVIKVNDGVYKVADADDIANDEVTKVTEMEVYSSEGATGTLVINGLAKKNYYLEETQTKAGYNLLSGRVELKIVEDASDFTYSTTIVNKQGFTLPQTGGIGTLMFIIIGGVLMAGGICLIVPNKKRAV